MCERAGVDAVWLRDDGGAEPPGLDLWTALAVAAEATVRARVGMTIDVRATSPATLANRLGALDGRLRDRLELGVSPGWLRREQRRFGFTFPDYVSRLGAVEEGVGALRARLAPISIAAIHPGFVALAARLADDVVVPAMPAAETGAALTEVQQACERTGRAVGSLGIGLEAPVSLGRTSAEAQARADGDPGFRAIGDPADVGIFGRLEQCQDRVIELAHAGVTDLRCVLPSSGDVQDVIAQLTAMVVGSTRVLTPSSPRSKAPPPPPGWGGRPSTDTGHPTAGASDS